MASNVNFKLSDLPYSLRIQAERQLAESPKADKSAPPPPPPAKRGAQPPIRLPKRHQPNATETRFNNERLNGKGLFEAITFNVPSGKYTPDWVYYGPSSVVCVEVKGSYKFGSQSGASAKFKEAVAMNPGITFIWAKWENGEWICKTIPPRTASPDSPSRAPVRDPPDSNA